MGALRQLLILRLGPWVHRELHLVFPGAEEHCLFLLVVPHHLKPLDAEGRSLEMGIIPRAPLDEMRPIEPALRPGGDSSRDVHAKWTARVWRLVPHVLLVVQEAYRVLLSAKVRLREVCV